MQGTAGGLPTKEGRQEQVKLPRVLRHAAFPPQMLGLWPHSSTSTQSVPEGGKTGIVNSLAQ